MFPSKEGAESVETRDPVGGLEQLQARLGYRWSDHQLLLRALTHRSYANERAEDVADNEVLEFLGDAVLGLIVSDLLYRRHPHLSEGQMSKLKSYLVSAETLGRLADEIGLGEYMLLGRGEEKTAGRTKTSLLANTFEALIAAIYLDGGLEEAERFLQDGVGSLLQEAIDQSPALRDFKSALQERVQAEGLPLPDYRVVEEEGPDHDKMFHVEVYVAGRLRASGSGKTKKSAEQRAARQVLSELGDREPASGSA